MDGPGVCRGAVEGVCEEGHGGEVGGGAVGAWGGRGKEGSDRDEGVGTVQKGEVDWDEKRNCVEEGTKSHD